MESTTQPDTNRGAKLSLTSLTSHKDQEIRLYSHSDIFYWWPVWALGFVLAFITYFDGGRLAVVPPGTTARRDWRVEVAPGRSRPVRG